MNDVQEYIVERLEEVAKDQKELLHEVKELHIKVVRLEERANLNGKTWGMVATVVTAAIVGLISSLFKSFIGYRN